jgi:polar amino acid transport system substrate-binding protein
MRLSDEGAGSRRWPAARSAALAVLAMVAGLPWAAAADEAAVLAPGGTLRAAINYGNPVLAQRSPGGSPGGSAPRGVSADLARALAARLGVAVSFVIYNEAGAVADAARPGGNGSQGDGAQAWDVAFLAVDPVRAKDIAFTAPYVLIEGGYLVAAESLLRRVDEVDAPGGRIAVARGSAYDLYLTRTLKQAALVRAGDGAAALELLGQPGIAAVAGVRGPLVAYAAGHSGVRVLPGRFMVIAQAMALPKARAAGLPVVAAFVEEMKASGFVARALAASGQGDAEVAPPAGGP